MSTDPGNSVADAIDFAEDDLRELHPDATRITVVVVARIDRPGRGALYRIGGANDTTVTDAEQIVQAAGNAARLARALRPGDDD